MERRQRIVARVYGKITYSSMVYAGLVGRVGVVRSKQGLFLFCFWGWLFITLTKTWLGKPCNTCTFAPFAHSPSHTPIDRFRTHRTRAETT
jgi:hypothetical protein